MAGSASSGPSGNGSKGTAQKEGAAQGVSQQPCKSCGGTNHKTKGNRLCPYFKVRTKQVGATASGSANAGAGIAKLNQLEWVYNDAPDEYIIEYDRAALDNMFFARMLKEFEAIKLKAWSMSRAAASFEEEQDESLLQIFLSLSGGFRKTVLEYAQKSARLNIISPIHEWEYYSFLSLFAGTELYV
jgi:hypothetical protein